MGGNMEAIGELFTIFLGVCTIGGLSYIIGLASN